LQGLPGALIAFTLKMNENNQSSRIGVLVAADKPDAASNFPNGDTEAILFISLSLFLSFCEKRHFEMFSWNWNKIG